MDTAHPHALPPPSAPAGPAPVPPSPRSGEVLVLVAHPQMEQSRVNRRLMQAARASGPLPGAPPSEAGRVEVRDLYSLYPDYLIDVPAERRALAAASLVVWQHPIHWYGMPPLLKLWADEVLGFGWAYGPGGDALKGKSLWLVVSTGGPEDSYHPRSYNRYAFDAFLPPYEQTAALCGLRWLPPMVIHGAHRRHAAEVEADALLYASRLRTWPRWPELDEVDECIACEVPPHARPSA